MPAAPPTVSQTAPMHDLTGLNAAACRLLRLLSGRSQLGTGSLCMPFTCGNTLADVLTGRVSGSAHRARGHTSRPAADGLSRVAGL